MPRLLTRSIALAAALSGALFAAACSDAGTTPNCSLPDAGCGPEYTTAGTTGDGGGATDGEADASALDAADAAD